MQYIGKIYLFITNLNFFFRLSKAERQDQVDARELLKELLPGVEQPESSFPEHENWNIFQYQQPPEKYYNFLEESNQ
jgi:hypothetical protein